MSSEQQNKNQVGGASQTQTAPENTVQIAPEGMARHRRQPEPPDYLTVQMAEMTGTAQTAEMMEMTRTA